MNGPPMKPQPSGLAVDFHMSINNICLSLQFIYALNNERQFVFNWYCYFKPLDKQDSAQ